MTAHTHAGNGLSADRQDACWSVPRELERSYAGTEAERMGCTACYCEW